MELTRDVNFRHGVGWAQRALGRIALAEDARSKAEIHLAEALDTFTSTQARFEVGRTHLVLAELTHAQENQDTTAIHLNEAYRVFRALQVPQYVKRTEQLARELGVPRLSALAD